MTRAHSNTPPSGRPLGLAAALLVPLCWAASAAADVPATRLHPNAAFSQAGNGRSPAAVFATKAGVYELDATVKAVRIWQRSDKGLELLRPAGGDTFVPYTTEQIEASPAGERPQRFFGVDAAGAGTVFVRPAGVDVNAAGTKLAVLNAGEFLDRGDNQFKPAVQVYALEETAGEGGALASAKITLAQEFAEALHVVTNGVQQFVDHVYRYPEIYVSTNPATGVATTNRLFTATTNLLDRTILTNWVYVVEDTPELKTRTNVVSQTGRTEPNFIDPRNTALLIKGFEYAYVQTNDWTSVSTNFYAITNYVFRYSTTTNASYLSTATDVAFLGDAGFVAPITADDFQTIHTGFAVFGTDPDAAARIFPLADLDKAVKAVAVDPETGDIYAAVPEASAVYRYPSPGGTPASWTTLADRTPRTHDDFVAGVPGAAGSGAGFLSNPDGVAIWRPAEGGAILLVADTANARVQAFDPAFPEWAVTNWLGAERVAGADFLVATNRVKTRKLVGTPFATQWQEVEETVVSTNYYRIEKTAFPLFELESTDGFNNPRGVFGLPGEDVVAVADTGARRTALFSLGLDALDSEEILALAVRWPGAGDEWRNLSVRDLPVTNGPAGSLAVWWDASLPGAAPSRVLVAREHETAQNELVVSVAPSRKERTYTLSAAPGGLVEPVVASATVPVGATEAAFTFLAKDGAVDPAEVVSWRDKYGNWAHEGSPTATNAVTNVVATTPAIALTVASAGGFSTNAILAVANVDPEIEKAEMFGYVVEGDPPVLMVQELAVAAHDWVAADEDLQIVWWATTNVNWGRNNLAWAVTNNDWAASAGADWSAGPVFEAAQNATASAITGQTGSGLVTNTIELLVASGPHVVLPYGYDARGLAAGTEPGTSPFLLVCTVLDKDGGSAIVSFPTPADPSGTADLWSYAGGDGGGGGGGESDAVYAARFTSIVGNDVTFELSLVSGTPQASDAVTLESATSLAGPWTALKKITVGSKTFPATINVNPAGSGDVRFYRVVQ